MGQPSQPEPRGKVSPTSPPETLLPQTVPESPPSTSRPAAGSLEAFQRLPREQQLAILAGLNESVTPEPSAASLLEIEREGLHARAVAYFGYEPEEQTAIRPGLLDDIARHNNRRAMNNIPPVDIFSAASEEAWASIRESEGVPDQVGQSVDFGPALAFFDHSRDEAPVP